MDKVLTNEIVEEILKVRSPICKTYQKCSFILPDGGYLKIFEHYEAYKFLVVEGLVSCIPDAEQLLSDLGYIRYSWIGYLTLADKAPTDEQYKTLEEVLVHIAKLRDDISIQIQSKPKFYLNYNLNDIPDIIRKIKYYYVNGQLLP